MCMKASKTLTHTYTCMQTLSKRKINMLEQALLHWRARLRAKPQQAQPQPVTLRKRRENVKAEDNWALFYYKSVMSLK